MAGFHNEEPKDGKQRQTSKSKQHDLPWTLSACEAHGSGAVWHCLA